MAWCQLKHRDNFTFTFSLFESNLLQKLGGGALVFAVFNPQFNLPDS
jgi:hypothetical protein